MKNNLIKKNTDIIKNYLHFITGTFNFRMSTNIFMNVDMQEDDKFKSEFLTKYGSAILETDERNPSNSFSISFRETGASFVTLLGIEVVSITAAGSTVLKKPKNNHTSTITSMIRYS